MAKQIKTEIIIEEYNIEELDTQLQQLIESAKESLEKAYAPYSGFKVGAAVLLDNNHIVIGNNQENAAYPSGLCAERVAVFHAGSNYPDQEIKAVAIAAKPTDSTDYVQAGPCGNCRQALIEYQNKQEADFHLLLVQPDNKVLKVKMNDLLPLRFDMDSLLGESQP